MSVREAQFYDELAAAPKPNTARALGVYALIERDGSLLLELRTDSPVWSLIAGRVEDGESIVEGLRREVAEETGLVVNGYEFFGHFSHPGRVVSYPDGNIYALVSFAYRVTVESFDDLRPGPESRDLRFFSKEELKTLAVPQTQRRVLECYVDCVPGPHLE